MVVSPLALNLKAVAIGSVPIVKLVGGRTTAFALFHHGQTRIIFSFVKVIPSLAKHFMILVGLNCILWN
jgi:hypothetical protein